MAGKKVEIKFESPGASRVIRDFDKLSKKEQEIILQGSKVGRALEKAGEKASQGGRKGASAFGSLQRKIGINIDLVSLLTKGLQLAQNEYQRFERIQASARSKQQTVDSALGNFIINNAQAVQRDPGLLKTVRQFAIGEGTVLGEGGIAEVIQAITTLRSGAGEGFNLKQQLGAIKEAITAKIIDPSVDIGAIATANLRTQKALGISQTKAQNVLTAFGPKAGGDVLSFVDQFGKLQGTTSAVREVERRQFGKPKTDFADILALEGIISQALGEGAKETTTIVQNLAQKVGSARVGNKQIKFQSEGTVERILELADRVLAGDFGTGRDRQQVLTSAGLEGSKGLATLAGLLENQKLLQQARTDIRGAGRSDVSLQERSLGFLSTSRKSEIQAGLQKGFIDAFKQTQVKEAETARAIDFSKQVADEFDVNIISRFLSSINRFSASTGLIDKKLLNQDTLNNLAAGVTDTKEDREKVFNLMLKELEGINKRLNQDKTNDTGGQ